MKLAIYARPHKKINTSVIDYFFGLLSKANIDYLIYQDFLEELKNKEGFNSLPDQSFNNQTDLAGLGVDIIVSLGGDGTLLDTLIFARKSEIPVMGINTGRLGFLANIPQETMELALDDLAKGAYNIESRSLLKLTSNKNLFQDNNLALNDFTIHKRDTSSMVTVETSLDGEYFNTYYADGIIAATPTGSTGYSLSCGGPIIFPYAKNIILTPVAPHNLNIRPIILPDDAEITFRVTGRGSNFLISLDSRYEIIDYSYSLTIQKAPINMKLIKLNRQSFIKTLREKLKWGIDKRNE